MLSELGEAARSPDSPEVIKLETLGDGMEGLSAAWGMVLANAAAVCFEIQSHEPGVVLENNIIAKSVISIHWEKTTEQIRKSNLDIQEATEYGACGVSILLLKRYNNFFVIERSAKGSGFDYWVSNKESSDVLFSGHHRLEVSGIIKGPASEIKNRILKKIQQMKKSRGEAPGIAAVVEFGKPEARVEQSNEY
jgi:hypothetical protein